MKTIATVISAVTLAVASASVPATDASQSSWATVPGYGYSAPYYGYGYAPYGYGVPVNPAVQLTDEQRKEIADQQARIIEEMQKAWQQAAEFHARQNPQLYEMQRTMQEMDAEMGRNMMKLHEQINKDMQDSQLFRPAFDRPAFAAPEFPEIPAPNFERPEFPEFAAPDFQRPEFPEYARPSFAPPAYPYDSNLSAEHQARMQEIKARVEASRKAAETRRTEALQRRKAPQPEAQTGEVVDNTGA